MTPDPEEFDKLYRRYVPELRKAMSGRINPDLVDDVVQETFIRLHRFWDRFDSRREVWPWLLKIATNVASSMSTREWREIPFDSVEELAEDSTDPAPGPEQTHLAQERMQHLLRRLNDRHRRVLVERGVLGLSYSEVADREGITVDATRHLFLRARRRLKDSVTADRGRGLDIVFPFPIFLRRRRLNLGRMQSWVTEHLAAGGFLLPMDLPIRLVKQVAAAALTAGVVVAGLSSLPDKASTGAGVTDPAQIQEASTARPGAGMVQARSSRERGRQASLSSDQVAPASQSSEVAVGVSAGTAGNETDGREERQITSEIWSKMPGELGDDPPSNEGGMTFYCESEVQQNTCDAIDAAP